MNRNAILLLAVAVGSAICWLPSILEPSLDLPVWAPLTVIALSAGLATILFGGRWLRFSIASAVATLAGVVAGYVIWPMKDGIAQSYAGIAALIAAVAVALLSILAGLIGRTISVVNPNGRRAIWIVLAGCFAFGPVALALRPALIARRVERNDRIAERRFVSLKLAVERTSSEPGNPGGICDGQALRRNYAGPQFDDSEWRYIAGNYVRKDGYLFGIIVDCSHPSRYTIDVRPAREDADGTRRFCTNESGIIGCDAGLNRWGPCVPCAK